MSYVYRKHRRVELDYMARILSLTAEPICDCALCDVSQAGARIAVLAVDMVPDEFILRFSVSSDVSRRCKVMWRKEDEIGVAFLKTVDADKLTKAARRARLLQTPCP
ncbi:MAG TPA: PilZ domain-containing protein [Xanthobacteraceae bacterium]|nr:PilZ domain-containing protein [Xanthobacteraceae bacterium]